MASRSGRAEALFDFVIHGRIKRKIIIYRSRTALTGKILGEHLRHINTAAADLLVRRSVYQPGSTLFEAASGGPQPAPKVLAQPFD